MPLIFIIPFLIGTLLSGIVTLDLLLRLEYRFHRQSWEADGRPHGFFWVPREIGRFYGLIPDLRSSLSSCRCSFVWLFSTPDWTKSDVNARRLLFWFRFSAVIWNGSILLLIFVAFYRQPSIIIPLTKA